MSRELLRQVFNKQTVAQMVSNKLRLAHQKDGSSIKKIGKITGIDAFTISNWYQAENTPNSVHLLMLMTFYPGLLRNILETIATARQQLSLPPNLAGLSLYNDPCTCEGKFYCRDKNVLGNIPAHVKTEFPLSQRQLWFLVKLQYEEKPNAGTISHYWQVSQRTAKRDIAHLSKNKIIRFIGACKNGYYVLNLPV
jgi:hypothetical protein